MINPLCILLRERNGELKLQKDSLDLFFSLTGDSSSLYFSPICLSGQDFFTHAHPCLSGRHFRRPHQRNHSRRFISRNQFLLDWTTPSLCGSSDGDRVTCLWTKHGDIISNQKTTLYSISWYLHDIRPGRVCSGAFNPGRVCQFTLHLFNFSENILYHRPSGNSFAACTYPLIGQGGKLAGKYKVISHIISF